MTRAGAEAQLRPEPPAHTPALPSAPPSRGDSTGFVAPEEVQTLPEVSLPLFSTPPAPSCPHSCHSVRTAPATRGAPSHLPARDWHGKSLESGPRSVSPCPAPLPSPTGHRPTASSRCAVLGDAETARQPLLGVGRSQCCFFCPLLFSLLQEDPGGSGQKEF